MSLQTATSRVPEIIAILDSLEAGERRLLRDVSWEEYEQLLDDLGEGDIAAATSFRKWARERKTKA